MLCAFNYNLKFLKLFTKKMDEKAEISCSTGKSQIFACCQTQKLSIIGDQFPMRKPPIKSQQVYIVLIPAVLPQSMATYSDNSTME